MINADEIVNEAIESYDNVEKALEAKGVDVPYGTNTINYGELVRTLDGTKVNQTYDPESELPQSGKAVAEAIAPIEAKAEENRIAIEKLEGNILKGYVSGNPIVITDVYHHDLRHLPQRERRKPPLRFRLLPHLTFLWHQGIHLCL